MYAEIHQEEEKKDPDFQRNLLRLNKGKNLHIPWLEQYLPMDYRGIKMPDYISITRDRAIIACFFHIISSIAGFSFYFIRKNKLYLIINIFSLMIALLGTFGVLTLRKWLVTGHAMITLAIFGSVCVYSILESFLNESLNNNEKRGVGVDEKNYTETTIILLLAIPYLIDFLTGIMTFYLACCVIRLDDERNPPKNNQELVEFELPENTNFMDKKCLICASKDKNAVFYNCGHKMSCVECAQQLKARYQPKCPLCRAKIIDIIQEFE